MEKVIDATNQKLGRVATEAASILMGKNTTSFTRREAPNVVVRIENASKLRIDPRKKAEKAYKRFSGYPGGLTEEKMSSVIDRKGVEEVVRIAVKGMLPKNKLQDQMLKHLKISA